MNKQTNEYINKQHGMRDKTFLTHIDWNKNDKTNKCKHLLPPAFYRYAIKKGKYGTTLDGERSVNKEGRP